MSSVKTTVTSVLCEFFEVVVHNILYTRKLYPDSIFSTKTKYGVPVHQSIHPDLNDYISQCLKAVNFHAKNNRLKRLFVCFHIGNKVFEKYVFDILNITNSVDSDPFLVDLEQSLRNFLIKLHTSQIYLDTLPEGASFSVRIETTAYSSLEFNQEPAYEDFPWIELNDGGDCAESADIVPLQMILDMENTERGIKRKSRLAVFEHVVEKEKTPKNKKFRTNRLDLGDSSPSESELVIDDEPVKKKGNPLVRLSEEPLNLLCEWDSCEETFDSWEKFNVHLTEHATGESENFSCKWKDCDKNSFSTPLLMQHVSFHGYLTRLKNIGQNVLNRNNNLPQCTLKEHYNIPIYPNGYTCEWEYCCFNFCTVYEFYRHIEIHIRNNPKVSKGKDIITCCWDGCNTKYSTQTKLAEHVRTHTKEKTVACPTCCCLFHNKTKFSDHRKRQLATNLQSYQCSQCLKLFPSERLLRDHMRSHINHYKCTMCDMTCPKPSILAKHIRFKHVKFKPYKCTHCTKTFVTKQNLDTHIKTHNADKAMKCENCEFSCRTKVGLDNHYATAHEKHSASYQCHCCKQVFKRGTYLTKHLMRVHNYHWPSGHSRFRYRKDQDNIYRLQTVRYESLEVTQEMIRSESMQSSNAVQGVSYNLKYDNDGQPDYVLSVSANGEQRVIETAPKQNNILITINDVDEDGNILRSEVVESEVVDSIVKDEDIVITKHELVMPDPSEHVATRSGKVGLRPKRKCRKRISKNNRNNKRNRKEVESVKVKGVHSKSGTENVRHFSTETLSNDMVKIGPPKSEA